MVGIFLAAVVFKASCSGFSAPRSLGVGSGFRGLITHGVDLTDERVHPSTKLLPSFFLCPTQCTTRTPDVPLEVHNGVRLHA